MKAAFFFFFSPNKKKFFLFLQTAENLKKLKRNLVIGDFGKFCRRMVLQSRFL